MRGPLDLPPDGNFVLRRATVPSGLVGPAAGPAGLAPVDIAVAGGRIAAITAHEPGLTGVDLAGRMVWPCPVDMHTHLDKGHIWPRAPNPDGTFMGALESTGRDREANWNARDVRTRFEFGLRCAYAHGTVAIRTHLDFDPAPGHDQLAGVRRAAGSVGRADRAAGGESRHAGALPGRCRPAAGSAGGRAWRRARAGSDDGPDLDADLDRFLGLAAEHGLDADCHIDETLDPASETLLHLADAALRAGTRVRSWPAIAARCHAKRPIPSAGPWIAWPRPASPLSACPCATFTCRIASPVGRHACAG